MLEILKFKCKEVYMANNCLNHGIRMFDMSFPARMLSAQKPKGNNLQRSSFCYRYYDINYHSVRDCPKLPEFTICSECSSTNHNWRNCTSTTKKCLTCSGEHRTMSNTCPSVKEASTKKVCKITTFFRPIALRTMAPPAKHMLKPLETAL